VYKSKRLILAVYSNMVVNIVKAEDLVVAGLGGMVVALVGIVVWIYFRSLIEEKSDLELLSSHSNITKFSKPKRAPKRIHVKEVANILKNSKGYDHDSSDEEERGEKKRFDNPQNESTRRSTMSSSTSNQASSLNVNLVSSEENELKNTKNVYSDERKGTDGDFGTFRVPKNLDAIGGQDELLDEIISTGAYDHQFSFSSHSFPTSDTTGGHSTSNQKSSQESSVSFLRDGSGSLPGTFGAEISTTSIPTSPFFGGERGSSGDTVASSSFTASSLQLDAIKETRIAAENAIRDMMTATTMLSASFESAKGTPGIESNAKSTPDHTAIVSVTPARPTPPLTKPLPPSSLASTTRTGAVAAVSPLIQSFSQPMATKPVPPPSASKQNQSSDGAAPSPFQNKEAPLVPVKAEINFSTLTSMALARTPLQLVPEVKNEEK